MNVSRIIPDRPCISKLAKRDSIVQIFRVIGERLMTSKSNRALRFSELHTASAITRYANLFLSSTSSYRNAFLPKFMYERSEMTYCSSIFSLLSQLRYVHADHDVATLPRMITESFTQIAPRRITDPL
jgi:hypothetical protein